MMTLRVILLLALVGMARGADLTLTDGRVLRDYVLLELDAKGAVIKHAGAIEGVPLALLPAGMPRVIAPRKPVVTKEEPPTAPAVWMVGMILERRQDGTLIVDARAPVPPAVVMRGGVVVSQEDKNRLDDYRREIRDYMPRVTGVVALRGANAPGPMVRMRVRLTGEFEKVLSYQPWAKE